MENPEQILIEVRAKIGETVHTVWGPSLYNQENVI